MANKLNDKHNGKDFEKKVFNKLKELIDAQDIPGVSRYNEIFWHKQYASKTAPNVMLNPDITIEVYPTPVFKGNRITKGWLYHDYQQCNIRDCNIVVGNLSTKFNVSKEAVIVRLKRAKLYIEGDSCGLLNEHFRCNYFK